jgi:hypothetical protein
MSRAYNGFEIDFLPVGSGRKSGDAIVARAGTPQDFEIVDAASHPADANGQRIRGCGPPLAPAYACSGSSSAK